jgi:hypothetical protein
VYGVGRSRWLTTGVWVLDNMAWRERSLSKCGGVPTPKNGKKRADSSRAFL